MIQISPNPSHQPRIRKVQAVVAKEVKTIIWIANVRHTAGEIETTGIGIDIVVLVVDAGADPVQGHGQDHRIIIVLLVIDQEVGVVVIIIQEDCHRVCLKQSKVIIY